MIVECVQTCKPSRFWSGRTNGKYYPHRKGKYAVTKEEFPGEVGPDWLNGYFCMQRGSFHQNNKLSEWFVFTED